MKLDFERIKEIKVAIIQGAAPLFLKSRACLPLSFEVSGYWMMRR
jgi:hypothetical protein